MPDAEQYLRRANVLIALSLGITNPVVAGRFWELAQDYLARAVKLRLDNGLSALPCWRRPQAPPRGARF